MTSADPAARPLTEIQAVPAGWIRRIPLSDAVVEQFFFIGADTDEAAVRAMLGDGVAFAPVVNGRREAAWRGNCVAIGPAFGAIEPLDSADLHLIQSGVTRLIGLLPVRNDAPLIAAEYNRLMCATHDRVRDMTMLRYATNARPDGRWSSVRDQALAEELAYKLAQFESRGRVVLYDEETFMETSWVTALLGQGVRPGRYDPLADRLPLDKVVAGLERMRRLIRETAEAMPSHATVLAGLHRVGEPA